ncbi:hypothetical protein PBPRB1318 [Photobacterium profundum SS9]|uniref:Uncharacterized protein n=1 Tax=Photobacterium profundum (strain SS9) TaxID=298386 RepID=Q6LHP1_PHOPR|nr:hypothetical protein PBPRB1318 [Photobacterium profundum SS9]
MSCCSIIRVLALISERVYHQTESFAFSFSPLFYGITHPKSRGMLLLLYAYPLWLDVRSYSGGADCLFYRLICLLQCGSQRPASHGGQ